MYENYYPCDGPEGCCPYDAQYIGSCEYHCGLGVSEDGPDPADIEAELDEYSFGSEVW